MLKPGILGREQMIVSYSNSAVSMGSGTLEVFSTPALVALMESAANNSVKKLLDAGKCTVGVSMNVKHLSPTPLGLIVSSESELIEVDGRRLVFKITAFDCAGVIGTAVHERMIIDSKPFMEKAKAKNGKVL